MIHVCSHLKPVASTVPLVIVNFVTTSHKWLTHLTVLAGSMVSFSSYFMPDVLKILISILRSGMNLFRQSVNFAVIFCFQQFRPELFFHHFWSLTLPIKASCLVFVYKKKNGWERQTGTSFLTHFRSENSSLNGIVFVFGKGCIQCIMVSEQLLWRN